MNDSNHPVDPPLHLRTPRFNQAMYLVRCTLLAWLAFSGTTGAMAATEPALTPDATALQGCITTQMTPQQTSIVGFGHIEASIPGVLRANEPGQIAYLSLTLGQVVPAGMVVGQLAGSNFKALWQQQKAEVVQAMANEKTAMQLVRIAQKTLKDQISTQQTLVLAEQNLAQAQAQLRIKKAQQRALEQGAILRAPTGGIVTRIEQSTGSFVQTGTAIAQITPTSQGLLRAQFFPTQSAPLALSQIKPGLHGFFLPLDSLHKVAVRVVSILPKDARNGALPVILEPLALPPPTSNRWQLGQTGQVHLVGAPFSAVLVPTRALILDQGQWWVLVKKPAGWARQVVRIGASTGENTVVTSGLKAGTVVLVEQTYLEFHRNFATRYQQPD